MNADDWADLDYWMVEGPPRKTKNCWTVVQRLYAHHLQQMTLFHHMLDSIEEWTGEFREDPDE